MRAVFQQSSQQQILLTRETSKLSDSEIDVTATKSSLIKPQLRVRFSPFKEIHECLHLRDYSDEEYSNTWYSVGDRKAIAKENISTLRVASKGAGLPAYMCMRGLEHRAKRPFLVRQTAIRRAQAAVLNEHFRQRKRGFDDEYRLATVYQRWSNSAMRKSQKVGIRDEMNLK
mmetsp:Transcript_9240/g.13322  ORF Transcript_9240/g.13322 Transcript_9240/m.13322 type:complete len:172 (+) Transcript_9240:55-570(+)|eukprot:CAMPEP_0202473286 /NCGR_PEP_ID=MMETSP1360-20130828/90556_1 /ASSEMBLY_ACC=CAM_ASM_000848 /TAXON_ID=515479 /ORGANISM="Licmophora paradoxa, Strain CCMP2313" /LENGTH=171 /DNA_ID=CAMNT_0049100133 /DNA_START=54 /DNA_END=569 /DNA_ORIENTATION=+